MGFPIGWSELKPAEYLGHVIPLSDLIQSGNIGLTIAARKFDPDRGFRFSTYAVPWIKMNCRCEIIRMQRCSVISRWRR